MRTAVYSTIKQIAVAVRNLEEKVQVFADEYGIGPWRILNCTPKNIREMYIHGERKDYSMRIALCTIGNIEWELLEPDDDWSIYAEFLDRHGQGLHHLGIGTVQHEDTVRVLDSRNAELEMSGNWGGMQEYFYYDTGKDLGFRTELFDTKPDFKHPEPDAIIPGPPDSDNLAPLFSGVLRAGIVVEDLEKTAGIYQDEYGIGPWTVFHGTLDGNGAFSGKQAVSKIDDIELVLLEPREKDAMYMSALRKHGDNLHHICLEAANRDRVVDFIRGKQSRAVREFIGERWVYTFDTVNSIGCTIQVADPEGQGE